jgi:8-oxo-dGTP diphosphatase
VENYKNQHKYYIAIDCIIFGFDKGSLKLLLIKRNFEPCKGSWSLMGGFLQPDESLDKAAKRILLELTGLKDIYLEQLNTYSEINRDPAGRVLSAAYFALIDAEKYKENNNGQRKENYNYTARWFEINKAPKLIFDHDLMVADALKRLKEKSAVQPIGFELLPDKFTIPQLQKLYEAINQTEFDKRNFRKKMLSYNILKQLDEKDKAGSKKGAFLYTIDQQKYNQMMKEGFLFLV